MTDDTWKGLSAKLDAVDGGAGKGLDDSHHRRCPKCHKILEVGVFTQHVESCSVSHGTKGGKRRLSADEREEKIHAAKRREVDPSSDRISQSFVEGGGGDLATPVYHQTLKEMEAFAVAITKEQMRRSERDVAFHLLRANHANLKRNPISGASAQPQPRYVPPVEVPIYIYERARYPHPSHPLPTTVEQQAVKQEPSQQPSTPSATPPLPL